MTSNPQRASPDPANLETAVEAARRAAEPWGRRPLTERLAILRRVRRSLGDRPEALAATVSTAWRANPAETLTAEVLPLLDACRFLERTAPALLEPRRPRRRLRPLWLAGTRLTVYRRPLGVVLLLAPSNYPLLLAGVQALQALAAGNAVLWKPGRDGAPAARAIATAFAEAGLPDGVLQVLPESAEAGHEAVAAGVDQVVLTGSLATGQRVLHALAERPTPTVMELSGCDAAVILPPATDLAARGVAFGLTLNSGFTCIAPRRLLVAESCRESFLEQLGAALAEREPATLPVAVAEQADDFVRRALAAGAREVVRGSVARSEAERPQDLESEPEPGSLRRVAVRVLADVPLDLVEELADVPAPLAVVESIEDGAEALDRIAASRFRLGVAVFGPPEAARALAQRAPVGVAVVNDVVVPTADPRLPFGGRGASGFGSTRGSEGLLEMTTVQAVTERGGRFRPHYDPTGPRDASLFAASIRMLHGSSLPRRGLAALRVLFEGARRGRRAGKGGS